MEIERESSEIDDSISMESVLIDNDGIVEQFTNTIAAKLLNDSPLPATRCIFRVPHHIRRQEVEAYKPYIVSIGPFHRGRHQFRLMENVKHWYLQCLLSRVNITLAGLIKGVVDLDKRASDCYAEPLVHLNKEDFVEMMVLDGCFLIELFRKRLSVVQHDENDPVFNVSSMKSCLYHDLFLLENQLPWFVLERLYNLTAVNNTTCEGNASALTDLVLNFFIESNIFNRNLIRQPDILHILDLLRIIYIPPLDDIGSQRKEEDEDQQNSKETEPQQRIPNVTNLSEAGIKFQKTSDCAMNIKFENGVFTIPQLLIHRPTGPLLRNLIAFEQCCHSRPHMISSYAILMDNLIDSSKDIDFLRDKEILVNLLSPEDAAQFFNKLQDHTIINKYYYRTLCSDVNEYYKTNWNKWMEKLRRDYFGTPWAIISWVAAFILLVLTMLQTVYTIQQYYHPSE